MIIKMLLDEVFLHIREFIKFDNIGMHKMISNKEFQRYYYSPENKLQDHELDKIINEVIKKEDIFEIIKSEKEIFIKDSDTLKGNVSINLIPIRLENELVFFINILTDEKFKLTDEIKENVLEIISDFSKVFCFEEMLRLDMVRDRMSLEFE